MEVGSSASSYEILAKLAEGGMAEIFLARSTSGAGVERMVVLKRILRHAAMDEGLVKLFVQEARLAAQLQHPNVVQVYDVGKLGSSYFFSMEYVHGETLRDLLLYARHKDVAIPIATVMTLAAGAAAGLSHAHDRRGLNGRPLGIVHADISPSNLMITREGVVKIVDFGIAKAEHHNYTDSETAVQGKLCYMSPEQVRSQPLDRRSDLFSLGIVLWELLTLQGLFRGDSDFVVMEQIITEQTMAPSQLRMDVPRDVDEIVLRLLAKNAANRFQTAAELLDAIEVAAMRMGMLLSTASVARQAREWFGERPEPWIEQTVGGSKRVVVSSEPVPKDLSQTIAGPKNNIDDVLDTMPPSHTRPPSAGGAPSWETAERTMESLEAMRDRLFREARERKTPAPDRPSPGTLMVESRKAADDLARMTPQSEETVRMPDPFPQANRASPTAYNSGRASPPAQHDSGRIAARGPAHEQGRASPRPNDPGRASPPVATGYDPGRASPPAPYDTGRPYDPAQAGQFAAQGAMASGSIGGAVPGRLAPPQPFGNPATSTEIVAHGQPRWRPREQRRSWIGLVMLAIIITLAIGGVTFALLWKSQMSDDKTRLDARTESVGDAASGSATGSASPSAGSAAPNTGSAGPSTAPSTGSAAPAATPGSAASSDNAGNGAGSSAASGASAAGAEAGSSEPDSAATALAKAAKATTTTNPGSPLESEVPPPKTAGKVSKTPKTPKTIEQFAAAGDHATAVGMCLGSKPTAKQRPTCATSACAIKDAPHAKRWLDGSPKSARPAIVQQCRNVGVFLEPPPDKPNDCADDPDACLK